MASFVDFPQRNKVLGGSHLPQQPVSIADLLVFQQCPKHVQEKYNAARVAEGNPEMQIDYPDGPALMVSVWKLTEEELAEVKETGLIYLHCLGYTHGPIAVGGNNPFTPVAPEEQAAQE